MSSQTAIEGVHLAVEACHASRRRKLPDHRFLIAPRLAPPAVLVLAVERLGCDAVHREVVGVPRRHVAELLCGSGRFSAVPEAAGGIDHDGMVAYPVAQLLDELLERVVGRGQLLMGGCKARSPP